VLCWPPGNSWWQLDNSKKPGCPGNQPSAALWLANDREPEAQAQVGVRVLMPAAWGTAGTGNLTRPGNITGPGNLTGPVSFARPGNPTGPGSLTRPGSLSCHPGR
jgi:hypothetical protein